MSTRGVKSPVRLRPTARIAIGALAFIFVSALGAALAVRSERSRVAKPMPPWKMDLQDSTGEAGEQPARVRPRASAALLLSARDPEGRLLTVEGRVTDADNGAPLSAVRIRNMDSPITSVVTDQNGAFYLGDVVPGKTLHLRVDKEGYLSDFIDIQTSGAVVALTSGTTRLLRRTPQNAGAGYDFPGITGIDHERRVEKVFVTAVRPGTPAERSGIRPGDRIVSVDGKSMDGLPNGARALLLKGPVGTSVSLVIESQASGPREVVLKREPSPSTKLGDGTR
jgi:membrane-associated protease RseP (regulator of RpoE activity)